MVRYIRFFVPKGKGVGRSSADRLGRATSTIRLARTFVGRRYVTIDDRFVLREEEAVIGGAVRGVRGGYGRLCGLSVQFGREIHQHRRAALK